MLVLLPLLKTSSSIFALGSLAIGAFAFHLIKVVILSFKFFRFLTLDLLRFLFRNNFLIDRLGCIVSGA
jgi:hypothetical protein